MSDPSPPTAAAPAVSLFPVYVVVAGGLGVSALVVILGKGPLTILVGLATLFLGLMVHGQRTGRLIARGGRIDRSTHPKSFMVVLGLYGVLVAAMLAITVGVLFSS